MPYSAQEAQSVQSACGSFWGKNYANQDMLLLVSAMTHSYAQRTPDSVVAEAAVGRRTIMPTRWAQWTQTTPGTAELARDFTNPVLWGSSTWGGSVLWGQVGSPRFWLPLPAGVLAVGAILSSVSNPKAVWILGQDFKIMDGSIVFNSDPRPDLQQLAGGDPLNPRYSMWLYGTNTDHGDLFSHFGWAAPAIVPAPTVRYRTIINSVWDTRVVGPNSLAFRTACAAYYGVPCVQQRETVQLILTGQYGSTVVITDKNSYAVDQNLAVCVKDGQVLFPGDYLVSDLCVEDMPDAILQSGVPYIDIATTSGTLRFANSTQNTTYTQDSTGWADVRFPVTDPSTPGTSAALTNFWEDMVAQGKASGSSVAAALSTRPVTGQPPAAMVARTVNPAEFLLKRLLGGNVVLVALSNKLPIPSDTLDFRQLAPPYTLIVTYHQP